MDYETWCKRSKYILADAEEYNIWRKKAQKLLLTDAAPRIAKLGESFYTGCGFHYSLEQRLGKLIESLALPWQPSANHLDKLDLWIPSIRRVGVTSLMESIAKAEQSITNPDDLISKDELAD